MKSKITTFIGGTKETASNNLDVIFDSWDVHLVVLSMQASLAASRLYSCISISSISLVILCFPTKSVFLFIHSIEEPTVVCVRNNISTEVMGFYSSTKTIVASIFNNDKWDPS
jgi:hypothetical protein